MPFPLFTPQAPAQRAEKHRLFITFPVFLMMLGMSVLSGMRADIVTPQKPENGAIFTVTSRPETLVLGNDAVARVLPGAIILDDETVPVLSQGEVVIGSPEIFLLSVKGLTLTGWNGTVRVIRNDDSVTIAALTTPVLVHSASGDVLIPVRRQWTASAEIHSLEQGMQRWLTERTTQEIGTDTLRGQLPIAVELLGNHTDERRDRAFIHDFATTADGWLLGAFHPATRDLTWTLPRPDTETQEQYLLSLVSFLPSDFLPEPVSAVAFDRWGENVKDYLSIDSDIGIRVAVQEQAKAFSLDTMPERAERADKVLK